MPIAAGSSSARPPSPPRTSPPPPPPQPEGVTAIGGGEDPAASGASPDTDAQSACCHCDPGGESSRPSPPSSFDLFSFFHFIRRFWNQILICRSVRQRACAISIRLRRVRYRLKWNSFSSSKVW